MNFGSETFVGGGNRWTRVIWDVGEQWIELHDYTANERLVSSKRFVAGDIIFIQELENNLLIDRALLSSIVVSDENIVIFTSYDDDDEEMVAVSIKQFCRYNSFHTLLQWEFII